MKATILARLQAERAAKRPVVLLTRLSDGAQLLWPGDDMPAALVEASKSALGSEEAGNVTEGDATWFVHPHNPPLRIIVVGAVHIAQAMAPMAAPLGFAMVVVDPRRAFASEERLPGVTLSTDWPDEAMEALAPDARTAVVTLTHDPKLDDPALDAALKSEAFYIGALGSRRTHAPVGLNIEAITAPEIALSIMAEIVAARRGAALGAVRPIPGLAA
jgi:xanthine dehydrogenase accessory factor